MREKIAIIGAGQMGTAIAQRISPSVGSVILFARNPTIINSINHEHRNLNYLSSLNLNSNISASPISSISEQEDIDTIILAVPSKIIRGTVEQNREYLSDKKIITTAKGIEYPSLLTMSEIIQEVTTNTSIASFSGPNFADEIAYGHLAGVTIGVHDLALKKYCKSIFNGLFMDFSNDTRGVEYCGIVKNVYAIAVGIWDSMYSNYNAHYTFLNFCYKEMKTALDVLSDDQDIASKFCGFGDFNLTSNIDKSRNRTVGLMIGKNLIQMSNIKTGIVIEGVKSSFGVQKLLERHSLSIPIINFTCQSMENDSNINQNLSQLIKNLSNNEI